MERSPIDLDEAARRHDSEGPLETLIRLRDRIDPQARYERVRALSCLRRKKEAIREARALQNRLPADPVAQSCLTATKVAFASKRAMRRVAQLLVGGPVDPRRRAMRASLIAWVTVRGTAAHRAAVRDLRDASREILGSEPGDRRALMDLAGSLGDLKEHVEAMESLERLRRVGMPPCPTYARVEMFVTAGAGRWGEARAAHERYGRLLDGRASRWAFSAFRFRWVSVGLWIAWTAAAFISGATWVAATSALVPIAEVVALNRFDPIYLRRNLVVLILPSIVLVTAVLVWVVAR